MVYSLTWFPDIFDSAHLKYSEYPDWRNRGRGDMGLVRGVMIHHTAGARTYNMPSLNLLVKGRSDLPGPLAQLGLGRDGTFYIIAAGRANHAGKGQWRGIKTGNSSFIGIEVENAGTADDPYPEVQMDALRRGVAAILRKIGADATMVCGHKEFAPDRKIDPLWDLPPFREQVAQLLAGTAPPARPIPAHDDQARPTLRRGARGAFVTRLQELLGISPTTGNFGPVTEARLRSAQRAGGVVPDGIAGPRTWALLDRGVQGATAAPAAAPNPNPAPAPVPAPIAAVRPAVAAVAMAAAAAAIPMADDPAHPVRADGRQAFGPDGKRFATRSKQGFVTYGTTGIDSFLATHPEAGAGLSPSVLRTVAAVMANEGKLEAVNSYDNAFLSFGIMQWTAGAGSDPGELAALLARLQAMDGQVFADCFGRYGLGVDVVPGSTTGRLVLDGRPMTSAAQKAVLRGPEWAYRFWRAGHDPVVRHCQIVHAGKRLDAFSGKVIHGHPLRAWASSELGMAMLLDQHVNRPGHVPKTLDTALGGLLAAGAVPADPAQWSDADEDRLIDRYVELRAATSMTHSTRRAARLDDLAHAGKLSAARGSFA